MSGLKLLGATSARAIFVATTMLGCAIAGGASAQDAGAAAAASASDVIVVTSQFREQNILDVPIAVTAYDQEFLRRVGINEFDQLSNFVPGFVVQIQSVNNPGFVLRGITSDSGGSNIEPRVSVFQNGISIARARGSAVQLFDLERVEVLKGPQGTLFGRSAQIGAVHLITQKPTYELGAGLNYERGNFSAQTYDGFVNIPLAEDKLAIRLAGIVKRRDGFVENATGSPLNGVDSFTFRASARADLTEKARLDLILTYGRDEPPGTSFKSGVIPALGGDTDPNNFASLNTFGGFLGGQPLSVSRETFDITAILGIEINDSWSVTSTTGYRNFNSLEVFDPDGSAFDLFIFAEDAEAEQISSDVRFSYDGGGRLKGFFGGGVFQETGTQSVPLGFDIGNTLALFSSLAAVSDPVDGIAFFGGSLPIAQAFLTGDPAILAATLGFAGFPAGVFQVEQFANSADNFSFDIFSEVSYQLTDRLTLTAGGRFTRDNKETLFASSIPTPNPITPFIIGRQGLLVADSGGQISSRDFDVDNTFSGFAWRGVVDYRLTDDTLIYFNYSRGRRPQVLDDDFSVAAGGGVNANFEVIAAETVTSYEAGLKSALFDKSLTIEAAGYYYGYRNFQTGVTVDAGVGQPPIFQTVNAGNATSYGAEFGLNFQPVEQIEFFATYGWNRGRFDDVDSSGNPQDFAGNQFRLSPDHSASAGLNLRQRTRFGELFLTPTATYKSKVFFEDENQMAFAVVNPGTGATVFTVPEIAQDGFVLVNLRGGVRFNEGRYGIHGFVENLTNKEYIIDAGNTGGAFGIPTFIAGPPRFYGGGFSIRF